MGEFINNLTPAQATLISSILSVIVALSVIFINRWIERGKDKKEKYDAVKKYANPIIFASEQLAWRIKEILEFNGVYLLPNAPENGFSNISLIARSIDYRIYLKEHGEQLVLLLIGGDKSTQSTDIKTAKRLWEEYLKDHK